MRSRAGPVTEISVYATGISVTGMKTFPHEHSSPGDRDKTLQTKWLHFCFCFCFRFWLCYLEFVRVDGAENEPARLQGSYEEALGFASLHEVRGL